MKKIYTNLLVAMLVVLSVPVMSQVAFTNANSKLVTPGTHSGCPVTVTDWNGDGLDDIVRLDDGRYCHVEVQQTNQMYLSVYLGDFGGGAWAMTVADVDHNGYKDVVADGSGGIGLLKTNAGGTGATMVWLANSGFFLQNATFGDFNNDGWIDLFACDDDAPSHIYLNDGTGNLNPSTIIDFDITPGAGITSDDSGNYGSVFTDFDNDGDMDLYIAKCRQSSSSTTDPRRIDVLFVNDGSNNYTNMASTYGVANGWQTWTASFGDLDNDGDLDLVATNHDHESQIWENDGTGHYTDITSLTGFDITDITPIECTIVDLDNDGYNDIMATGSDARVYMNNGNMTFTRVNNLFNGNNMESFAVGDLNHDGFLDVYASYATIYTNPSNIDDVIWMNNKNSNHFICLNLKGTVSNEGAIGARATLYSSLGTQVAEIRAGESYGTCNTSLLHFGLGAVTTIDSIVIRFTSGITQTLVNPDIDQFISIIENDCVSPTSAISASGPLTFCPGQFVTLTAPAGYNYLWSDGSTGQAIIASATSEINVQVSAPGNNCVGISPTLSVLVSPNETPTITASSSSEFCDGEAVDISGPAGLAAYTWSNGATTQTIHVTTSGTYTLTYQGVCQAWTSTPINVTVHTPVAVAASNVTLPVSGATTLTATAGNNILWYDAPAGGNVVATGNTFTTPWIINTTNYYVESGENFTRNDAVGIVVPPNSYSGNTTNALMFFSAVQNCTLNTVTVFTDLPGNRLIELRDVSTNALVDSQTVYVPMDSAIVTLNFVLTAGTDYSIGTNSTVNQQIPGWGNVSPRLRRNNGGVTYPYTLPNFLSITSNNQGNPNLYYYFYDWKILHDARCAGPRQQVTITVTAVGINELTEAGIKVYPNPASDLLNIDLAKAGEYQLMLTDYSGRVVRNEMISKSGSVSLQGIAAGIYNLRMQNETQLINYKVVVE
ncbi:MAG: FG-GAP-like repeat-containing protein [Bacteroidota bacterium]